MNQERGSPYGRSRHFSTGVTDLSPALGVYLTKVWRLRNSGRDTMEQRRGGGEGGAPSPYQLNPDIFSFFRQKWSTKHTKQWRQSAGEHCFSDNLVGSGGGQGAWGG